VYDLLRESFTGEWERLVRWTPRIAVALVVVLIAIIVGKLVRRAVAHALERTDLDSIHLSYIGQISFWVIVIVGFSIALAVLGLGAAAGGLLTGGGLAAVILGFAFREIGENLIAGLLLAFRRPFRVGDLIATGDSEGTVKGIAIRHTHLRTGDGRDVFVPSSQIFKNTLVNYTLDGLRRFSLVVGIDYRDDSRDACALLEATGRGVDGVLAEPGARAWISALRDGWIELELAFWIDVFADGIDVASVRTELFHRCSRGLLERGFTVSSEVARTITIASRETSVEARG